MCIALAIVGAGVAAAAGSAIAGSEAANATTSAANTAAAEQQSALTQQEALAAPYTGLGTSAIPQLQSLLGLNGKSPEAALSSTPGYQFTLNQGLNATKNSAAASGLLLSGNTLQGLDQYASGLADQTYQNQLQDTLSAVGMGQAAAAGQASNIGATASNLGKIAINQGNTLAGIDANTIAGIDNSLTGAANNYLTYQTLQGLQSPGIASDPSVQNYANSYNSSLGYTTG